MLLVYSNDIDVTANVKRNSIRIAEQLNNRANTCSFVVDQADIGEGSQIEIFEGFRLTAQANSGQAVLQCEETFQYWSKFRPGDELILDIKGSGQVRKTILSINHTAKTITLTTNLSANLAAWTKCGRVVFSGVTMKNPDEEIGFTGTFSYKVNATDWTKIFDAKVVVETFQNQYSREIFGRILYEYHANDSEQDLDLFESAWTNSGVALAMTADTTDRIQGTNSMKTGSSAAGTATWTKTISPVDLTGKEHFRLWHKIGNNYGNNVTSLKFRVGSDASNYYEGTSDFIGAENQDCWNFEAFRFDRATKVGTPVLTAIDWLQIEVVCTGAIPSGNLHFDHAYSTAGGFTLNNTIRGDKQFDDVRVQYKKPTVVVDDICKLQNFFWFIDYERDLHFFKQSATAAPFSLTDSSQNFDNLSITADISQLKNRQTVRGGEAIDQTLYVQDEVTDGKSESWRLDYKPKGLEIWVDTTGTGSSFVQKTVGVENLDDPASFDYLFNFNEKVVRKASATTPPNGSIFRRKYYPYKPIRVRVKDDASIAAMKALLGGDGIYDGAVINDTGIRDWNEARIRAKAEVDAYANPIVTATFETEIDGLTAGQLIRITDSSRGIDQDFLIQKVSKSSKNDEVWKYSVECGSTMFGIIEFFQLLLKRSEKLLIDVSEIVDVVQNDDETITIQPVFTFTQKDKTVTAATKQVQSIDAEFLRGFRNDSGRASTGYARVLNGEFSFQNIETDCQRFLQFSSPTIREMVGGVDAAITGTKETTDRFGFKECARNFDGTDDWLNYTVPSYTNPDEITFIFRNKPTATSGNRAVITYAGHLIQANQAQVDCWTNVANESHSLTRANSGTWETIAISMSFITNQKKWYVDGRLVQTDTIAVAKNAGSWTNFQIGQYGTGGGRFYQGDIDDVQVYHKILTDLEIENISNGYQGKGRSFNVISDDSNNWSSFGIPVPLKPSKQYTLDVWVQVPKDLTNVLSGGGAMVRIPEYAAFTEGAVTISGQLATNTVVQGLATASDFTKYSLTFTTNASTNFGLVLLYAYNATGLVRFGEVKLRESTAETQSNPAIASFCQAI